MNNIKFNFKEVKEYTSNINQIAGIKKIEFREGRAKGVEAFEIKTGSGLDYSVLVDRGLDIARAGYRGINLSYFSNTGIVAPAYFEEEGEKSLRSLTLGFLTTCGLNYYGRGNQKLSIHGRVNNIPAEEICVDNNTEGEEPYIEVSGKVKQAKFFGENLIMSRKVKSYYGESKIIIKSRVTNVGYKREPLMFLYHVNFGYPFLAEGTELLAPIRKVIPADERSKDEIEGHRLAVKPREGYKEKVYYLDMRTDKEDRVSLGLLNKKLGFGVYERFNKNQLPYFMQWKQMGKGYYVMGLEPCTNFFEGMENEKKKQRLQYIEAGETRDFELELGIVSIEGLKKMVEINTIKNTYTEVK